MFCFGAIIVGETEPPGAGSLPRNGLKNIVCDFVCLSLAEAIKGGRIYHCLDLCIMLICVDRQDVLLFLE